jgi:PPK2 family polyphosphate:nucleotide phosphotransferase
MTPNLKRFRAPAGRKVDLGKRPTAIPPLYRSKEDYQAQLGANAKEMDRLQRLLYSSGRYALLLIFQGMDAAGKDGAIRSVMSGVDPQGCQVFGFKQPSSEELKHDFLWRTNCRLPERGRIGIFNRSYYEEVLIAHVRPDILRHQGFEPDRMDLKAFWKGRYRSIVDSENHLHRENTRVLKFFLHLSKAEQARRFLARIEESDKNWKFDLSDIRERALWNKYRKAYEECLTSTTIAAAPWHIIPADDKKNARLIISSVIIETLRGLDMSYPKTTPERRKELLGYRKLLDA